MSENKHCEHDFSNEDSEYCTKGCGVLRYGNAIETLVRDYESLQKKCEELEKSRDHYKLDSMSAFEQIDKLKYDRDGFEAMLKDLEKINAKLTKKYEELEADYKKAINTYLSDNRHLWSEKAELKQQNKDLQKKCDDLEDELNRYKISNESDSKSLCETVKENLAMRKKVKELIDNGCELAEDNIKICEENKKLEKQNAKLIEALKDWIDWENKQIEQEGEYCGKEINRLIKQGRQVLAELGIK